jgi:hypothetical protein
MPGSVGCRRREAAAAALLVLVTALVGAGRAQPQDVPQLTPGLVPVGTYGVWCDLEVSPPDAHALGTRPARDVTVGESETVVRTWTEVTRLHDDGRRQTVPVAGGCTVRLGEGYYEVRIHEALAHRVWEPHPADVGITLTPQLFRTTTRSWRVRVADFAPRPPLKEHPCDGSEARSGETGPEAEALRRAVASALASRGARVGPEHVYVHSDGGPLLTYAVYLESQTRQPRHTFDCQMAEHQAGNLELPLQSALHVVLGMQQEAGDRTRVSMRVVEIATSVVLDAGMGTVDGTGEAAATAAAHEAAAGIRFEDFGW